MTKKDYIILAKVIRKTKEAVEYNRTNARTEHDKLIAQNIIEATESTLATDLMNDNPRFNFSKFQEACELQD